MKVDKEKTKCADNPVSPRYTGERISGADVAPRIPFGQKPHGYVDGTIFPAGVSPDQMDDATRAFYDLWKQNYLRQGCGADRWFVRPTKGFDGGTVSEAHGYGMILAALFAGHDADAKRHFDGMYYYFREHPSNYDENLMAWYQTKCCHDDRGEDAATDGDIDIAYALLLADRQWGSCGAIDYRKEAERVIDAIRSRELNESARYTLLGDWAGPGAEDRYRFSTRTSDFIIAQFRSFYAATSDVQWRVLVNSLYDIIEALQKETSPKTGLLPDFVVNPLSNPAPAPAGFLEGPNDGNYFYNACRTPWRLGTDYLLHGDSRMHGVLQRLNRWMMAKTGGDPLNIAAGYRMDGAPVGGSSYQTMAFIAPFGVSAMVDRENQAWLNALWKTIVAAPPDGYYEDSIKLMSMVVMSGNWWAPEKTPAVTCAK